MLMERLEDEVKQAYSNLFRVYQPQQEAIIYSNSQIMYDETCNGGIVKLETTTPMGWPMGTACKNVGAI
ncbi:unnamed protein product [Phytophthora lilii]|uniref:Unnamed protein product n=1 Tax=Phytophthora lilii TaxID=2077276 RepID=A0A9W6TLX6_9STRA|nr:unnamed protein product [Phytophthora lilii]